jgi:hypothetical protein
MNLRAADNMPALSLLPLTGVQNQQISEILEIAPLEFARLWNLLPRRSGRRRPVRVTRQQVINLRKSARERLIRRIGGKYRLL